MPMTVSSLLIAQDETEELVEIARRHGFHKVVDKLLGNDDEDDDEDGHEVDSLESSHLPSRQSRGAICDTLRWMGCAWED